MKPENLLGKWGIFIDEAEVEVGKEYPIYGFITKIINDTVGAVEIEVNYNISLSCHIESVENINTLKSRAFEPGIFFTTITSKTPICGTCGVIVFGRMNVPSV